MGKRKVNEGDTAIVVASNSNPSTHFFPELTRVKVGKRRKIKTVKYYLYYCTALDGPQKGLTQLVATNSLEKIEPDKKN